MYVQIHIHHRVLWASLSVCAYVVEMKSTVVQ